MCAQLVDDGVHWTLRFESRQMMIVLLLLGVCVGMGSPYEEEEYGTKHSIRLHRKAQSLEFIPKYYSDAVILWNRDNPPAIEDSRRKVMGVYYVISNLTQRDSGRYIMRDKNQKELATKTIEVIATTMSKTKTPGEILSITFDLEPNSCNIYFFPESDHEPRETEIVRRGRLQDSDEFDCMWFNLLRPCGILNEDLQMSCSGRFEVRDQNGDTALVVLLEMESLYVEPSNIGICVGVFIAVISCCCGVRRCCCTKSSSKKDRSETADAEPAVHYQKYDSEPVGPSRDQLIQPSETNYPAQPSYTPSGPLIHNPPTVNVLPAYSEVSAPAEQADAPPVPVHSDPEPRFELKGMNFPSAPPLSSDSTCCDVYTSDKLNFL